MLVHELAHEKSVDNSHGPLYHASGNLIVPKGAGLSSAQRDLLLKAGIELLYELEGKDSVERFEHECKNLRIQLDTVQAGQVLSRPIYDEHGLLLLEAGKPLTAAAIERLKKRGMRVVYRRKTPEEMELAQYERYSHLLVLSTGDEKEIVRGALQQVGRRTAVPPKEGFTPDWVDSQLSDDLHPPAGGVPLKDKLKRKDATGAQRGDKEKTEFIDLHHDAIVLTRKLLTMARDEKDFDGATIGRLAGQIVHAILKDKDLVLNLVHIKNVEDYLVHHSVNVCLISVNIATALGLAADQIIEIAFGALLHDLGMIKIGKAILEKAGPLTAEEKLEVEKHPIYGLELLQLIKGIPKPTPYVAYQSHERLDKSGYVRQREGKQIHLYAKIVAVADVYEALTSERAYRKAFLPYQAMEQIIAMGNKRKLDPEVIRAFLRYMSLFPVGSWVQLSNGNIGKVVSANESNYDRPVVRLIYDAQKKKLVPPLLLDLRSAESVRVERVVDSSELESALMDGF
ncbi:MAG: HD-GYP domain-containing protein [Planctomycetota bacterium]|nr:HD-GYP domain-containing protein [Planctomycetota bacterium]